MVSTIGVLENSAER
jgi:hypothetical protein